jgi:two-component system sensor histidine kinase RpfC
VPPLGKLSALLSFLRRAARRGPSVVSQPEQTPLPDPAPAPDPSHANGQTVPGTYRVLLAEDNATVLKVLQRILEHAGHRCVPVENGEEALAELVRKRFDIAMVDLHLARMSGIEVIKSYHFMHQSEDRIPIMVFSADGSEETRAKCLAAGAAEFMAKPIRPDALHAMLDRLIREAGGVRNHLSLAPSANSPAAAADAVINFDMLTGLDRSGQGVEFVDALLAGFVRDSRARIESMGPLLQQMRHEEFREAVHAVKGAAMSIGASGLKQTCQQIEKMGPAELELNAVQVLTRLQTSFEQLCGVLDHYRARRDRVASND